MTEEEEYRRKQQELEKLGVRCIRYLQHGAWAAIEEARYGHCVRHYGPWCQYCSLLSSSFYAEVLKWPPLLFLASSLGCRFRVGLRSGKEILASSAEWPGWDTYERRGTTSEWVLLSGPGESTVRASEIAWIETLNDEGPPPPP